MMKLYMKLKELFRKYHETQEDICILLSGGKEVESQKKICISQAKTLTMKKIMISYFWEWVILLEFGKTNI